MAKKGNKISVKVREELYDQDYINKLSKEEKLMVTKV